MVEKKCYTPGFQATNLILLCVFLLVCLTWLTLVGTYNFCRPKTSIKHAGSYGVEPLFLWIETNFNPSNLLLHFSAINYCANNPCNNDGICTNQCPGFQCQCQPCFTGETCDIRKYFDCRDGILQDSG